MTLTDQRIVVIGGSSGMGLATARAAALAGATVTIASSSSERVAAAVAELPEGCDGAVLDVRDEAAVAGLFERLGASDHVVFTAGDAFTPRPLADLSLGDARSGFDVRFWGAVP
jgi:NAD(P)-dependent dehydrogenase (short-subunit alcohol dehydrogenase family)